MIADKLSLVMPRAPAAWLAELAHQAPAWGIDTPNEIASFVAQLAHESAEFTRLEENLSYSAQRLVQVWPRRFSSLALAQPCAHNPERLANRVYADRLGNGDEASGDGWRYRGRGPIQLTGRHNYAACAAGINEPLIDFPELLLVPRVGIRSACWYWRAKDLDLLDDDEDVTLETRRVNGGEHGLAQRKTYFDKTLALLSHA